MIKRHHVGNVGLLLALCASLVALPYRRVFTPAKSNAGPNCCCSFTHFIG